MKSGTCGRCDEEIRYGARDGVTGWFHREAVDHMPIHGRPTTAADRARWEAEQDRPRFRLSGEAAKHCPTYQDLWPLEEYTTREVDIIKDPDATRRKRRLAEFRGIDIDAPVPIPPVEVARHPADVKDYPATSGIAQIYNLVTGVTRKSPTTGKTSKSPKHPPMAAPGWELRRFTHARGPYMGSGGEVLSISDTVVMGARGPEVDGGVRVAVASWRDGSFDFAYTGILKDGVVTTNPANSDALKAWIKDTP